MLQYTYLAKLAEGCTSQTAILYRDNECILPLVDLLERNGIPYQMRNAELSFFSHRTILDIINIIKLAQNPMDTEAFLQIYYKIGTYLRKQDAIRIARISEEKRIPVLDVAASTVHYRVHDRSDQDSWKQGRFPDGTCRTTGAVESSDPGERTGSEMSG